MPRTARVFQRAVCYHILNRGLNRRRIFEDEADKQWFSDAVADYKKICGARVYHWVWMDTHFHMLAEVVYDNLRGFVGGIEQVYAQHHHMRHGSSGVFWAGRFKSKPVELGEYLTRCGRYIERNPVRAGLVRKAWDYKWSSAGFYVNARSDEVSDLNKYVWPTDEPSKRARIEYSQELSSSADDEWMRKQLVRSAIGTEKFLRQLKVVGGRYRRKRGRPAKVCE